MNSALFQQAYAGMDALIALNQEYFKPIKQIVESTVDDWCMNFKTVTINASLGMMAENYVRSRVTPEDIIVYPTMASMDAGCGQIDQRICATQFQEPLTLQRFIRGRRFNKAYVLFPEDVFEIIPKEQFYKKLAHSYENQFILLSG